MKYTSISFVLVLIFFGTLALAQEPEKITPTPLISSITIFPMANVQSNPFFGINDFRNLAPNSVLLANPDFNSLNPSSSSLQIGTGGLSLLVSFREKEKTFGKTTISSGLRLGAHYQSQLFNSTFSNKKAGVLDTLRPSVGSDLVFLDSVFQQNIDLNHWSNVVGIDASYLYRINPQGRWSFFAGLGLHIGATINNRTSIDYRIFRYNEYREEDGSLFGSEDFFDFRNSESKSENIKNRSGFYTAAFIPIGVDFRIGKTSEFWRRTHLFFELRPLINVRSIPEVGTIISSGFQHGLGLRVTIL